MSNIQSEFGENIRKIVSFSSYLIPKETIQSLNSQLRICNNVIEFKK